MIIASSNQEPEERQELPYELFERLCFSSSYPEHKQEIIMNEVRNCFDRLMHERLADIRRDLELNQLDPVVYGFNYNQGDIIKHLKKLR